MVETGDPVDDAVVGKVLVLPGPVDGKVEGSWLGPSPDSPVVVHGLVCILVDDGAGVVGGVDVVSVAVRSVGVLRVVPVLLATLLPIPAASVVGGPVDSADTGSVASVGPVPDAVGQRQTDKIGYKSSECDALL